MHFIFSDFRSEHHKTAKISCLKVFDNVIPDNIPDDDYDIVDGIDDNDDIIMKTIVMMIILMIIFFFYGKKFSIVKKFSVIMIMMTILAIMTIS